MYFIRNKVKHILYTISKNYLVLKTVFPTFAALLISELK